MGWCGQRLAPMGATLAPRLDLSQGAPAAAQPGASLPGTQLCVQPHQTPSPELGVGSPSQLPRLRPGLALTRYSSLTFSWHLT